MIDLTASPSDASVIPPATTFRMRGAVLATQLALVVGGLSIWQFAPDSIVDEISMSRPSLILRQIISWLQDGTLAEELLATLGVVIGGLLWGGIAGIILGIAAGVSRIIADLIEPALSILFALPKIALIPLFILWFGVSGLQHIVFTASVVFFFFFFAAFEGVRTVPPALRNMLALAGASTTCTIRVLYIPASFGWLLAGLRLAMPYAFVSAISAEIVASRHGLGTLVKSSASVMDTAGMFAAVTALVLLSVAFTGGVLLLGGRSRWHL